MDPEAPRFERLPAYAPASSAVTVARDIRIERETHLVVDEEVQLTGYHAAWLRQHLTTLEKARRKEWAQQAIAATERTASVTALETRSANDPDHPLVLRLSYRLPHRCRTESGSLRCLLPAPWAVRYLEVEPVPDRRTPFEVAYPLRFEATTDIVPPGAGTVEIGREASGASPGLATWSVRPTRGTASLQVACTLIPGEHPASRYAEYHRTISQALRSVAREVTWTPR
jgi:hypothetical protein